MPETLRLFTRTLFVALFVPFFLSSAAFSQEPPNAPQTQYWVTDQAGVLSASVEQSLTTNAKRFEEQTTNQVVVVTVNSLVGWTIERYGRWLGNKWGIGQSDKNNGVLLLVAPKERKVRIEVGLGLEDVLSDATAQRIIDNEILPKFRNGDLQAGIVAGHKAILEALGGEYREKLPWEKLLHLIFLPLFVIGRFLGFGGSVSGGFSGGGGSFGGGGASGSW
ncbi:TPM domain-containing protein [Aliiroseovarius sp. F20344]|uniref:TPM domain-containing protein n=1 Tax=Aliiroseovarius sp. F20344 TaxID=2926414 RepID=UPI001FF2A19D|nr:TPM domain-containing protein [Aliiroseovarius sp. F20344]MCK0143801.1 TPM domain-containing protein [Aliiroseovarius sp. F20344]